jgi:hypothetical protein
MPVFRNIQDLADFLKSKEGIYYNIKTFHVPPGLEYHVDEIGRIEEAQEIFQVEKRVYDDGRQWMHTERAASVGNPGIIVNYHRYLVDVKARDEATAHQMGGAMIDSFKAMKGREQCS